MLCIAADCLPQHSALKDASCLQAAALLLAGQVCQAQQQVAGAPFAKRLFEGVPELAMWCALPATLRYGFS